MTGLSPGDTEPSIRIAALVLAAGSSRRLGQPKQLLPYAGSTLLGTTLDAVRRFDVDQRIVALGGAADAIRDAVDLSGFTVVDSVHHTEGCASSIVAALAAIDDGIDGFLLFLGDQPHVPAAAVAGLRAAARRVPLAVVRYRGAAQGGRSGAGDDPGVGARVGRGHPFWFGRPLFGALSELHGDKAVWKLLESGRWPVAEVDVADDVPLDVDTWDDYEQLVAGAR